MTFARDVEVTPATAGRNGHHLVGWGPDRVIALHGWLSDAASWAPFWQEIDPESHTWCFVDARGYGLSRERRGDYTMTEIALDALAVADSLGWDEFSLVGHSMSGIAVQRALLAAPSRVRSLVGVAAVPASGGGVVGDRRALFDRAVKDGAARATIIDRSTGGAWGEEHVRALTERSLACAEVEAVRGYLDSWADGDFHDEIMGSPLPVTVIVGDRDPSLSSGRMDSTWLAWYPDSRLEVLAGCGHYPMLEKPGDLARVVGRALSAAPA